MKYLYIGETNPEDIKGWGGEDFWAEWDARQTPAEKPKEKDNQLPLEKDPWAEWNERQTPAEKSKEQANQPSLNDDLLDYYSSIWSSIAQSQANQSSFGEDFWVEWDIWHSSPEEPKEQDNSWWYEYDAWWE